MLTKNVLFVEVPHYDELKPENLISSCGLKQDVIWPTILDFCPELKDRDNPKDRKFFYNVLNTIRKGFVDKIVDSAIRNRS